MSKQKIAVDIDGEFVIHDVKANPGSYVQKGQILFTLKETSSGNLTKIKALNSGKSIKVLKRSGNPVKKG